MPVSSGVGRGVGVGLVKKRLKVFLAKRINGGEVGAVMNCHKTKTKPKARRSTACGGSANLWWVTVNDSYTSHTYEISGTDMVSIQDVMLAARRKLKGTLVRDWHGGREDSPPDQAHL